MCLPRNPTFIVQDKGGLLNDPTVQQKYKPIGVVSAPRSRILISKAHVESLC